MLESKLALTATAHLVGVQENITEVNLDSLFFLSEDPVKGGIEIKQGKIYLPKRSGLGIEGVKGYD